MLLAGNMNLPVTHIFREGNCCIDKLANIVLTINSMLWMNDIPIQATTDFTRYRLGLPC